MRMALRTHSKWKRPSFRTYVAQQNPASIAAGLLKQFPAPTPVRVGTGYLGEVDLNGIPASGTAEVNIPDNLRSDQYVTRIDHTFHQQKDTLSGRWIAEYDHDSGTSPTVPQPHSEKPCADLPIRPVSFSAI